MCYSSASLALLQFVTNTLLAESTPGIRIKTALTRHDDLEVIFFFWFLFVVCRYDGCKLPTQLPAGIKRITIYT